MTNQRSWRVYVPFGSFGPIRHRKLADFGQNAQKLFFFSKQEHIRNIQYSFESEVDPGWGLFVFHKYFLIISYPMELVKGFN